MRNFVSQQDNVLWIAQTARHFSQRPSELIEIEGNSQLALDFDLACTVALMEHDNKRDYHRLESLIKSLGVLATGLLAGKEAAQRLIDSQREDDEPESLNEDDPNLW